MSFYSYTHESSLIVHSKKGNESFEEKNLFQRLLKLRMCVNVVQYHYNYHRK